MEYLPSHPEARTPEGKKSLAAVNSSLPHIATHLENIKPLIQREYEEWLSSEARRQKQQAERAKSKPKTPSPYDERAARDPALSSTSRLLDAGDHQELAVELARREIKRRDANRKATRKAGVSQDEEQYRRTAGFWDNWTSELADKQAEDEELFRRQMASTRSELDGGDDAHAYDNQRRETWSPATAATSRHSGYQYPKIARSEPIQYEAQTPHVRKTVPTPQPPRPPKEEFPYRSEASANPSRAPTPHAPYAPHAPLPPAKEQIYPERRALPTPETPQELPTPPPKIRDEAPPVPAKKQQRLTFKPAAYLENGEPIRTIFLPSQLRHSFLSIASDNTRRGLEMCGILCGTAVNNALFVRCLLIPEQNCTSDTCETENEGAMFEYCMAEDLLVLGWIHTHPTQTCFMSSRDLHTQSGYQVMLPESIAIVCAPKFEPE